MVYPSKTSLKYYPWAHTPREYINILFFISLLSVEDIYWNQLGYCGGSVGKESACNSGDPGLIPESRDPWRREWLPTPVFLPAESHGQRTGGLQSTGWQRFGHDWVIKHIGIGYYIDCSDIMSFYHSIYIKNEIKPSTCYTTAAEP